MYCSKMHMLISSIFFSRHHHSPSRQCQWMELSHDVEYPVGFPCQRDAWPVGSHHDFAACIEILFRFCYVGPIHEVFELVEGGMLPS